MLNTLSSFGICPWSLPSRGILPDRMKSGVSRWLRLLFIIFFSNNATFLHQNCSNFSRPTFSFAFLACMNLLNITVTSGFSVFFIEDALVLVWSSFYGVVLKKIHENCKQFSREIEHLRPKFNISKNHPVRLII